MITSKICPKCNAEQLITNNCCTSCGNIIKYITYTLDQETIAKEGRIYKLCNNCNNFYSSNLNNCSVCNFNNESRLYTRQEAEQVANRYKMQKQAQQVYTSEDNDNKIVGKIMGISSGILLFLATFLPFSQAQFLGSSANASYWNLFTVNGYAISLFAFLIILFSYKRNWIMILVNTILTFVVFSICVSAYVDKISDSSAKMYQSWGMGYYLIIMCILSSVISAVIIELENKKMKTI